MYCDVQMPVYYVLINYLDIIFVAARDCTHGHSNVSAVNKIVSYVTGFHFCSHVTVRTIFFFHTATQN